MAQEDRKNNIYLGFALVMLMSFLVSGCAIGTTRLNVAHDPLANIENKKQGNILVTQFVDKRKEQNRELIGNKRNGFGMVLGHVGMQEGVKLDVLLTKFFAEALNAAGYNAVVQDAQSAAPSTAKYDAFVTGDITEFWMDLYMKVWHKVEINTKALNPTSQAVIWEKSIVGEESNVLWVGATGEYEKIVSAALTKALNQAAQAYASDEFFKAIKK